MNRSDPVMAGHRNYGAQIGRPSHAVDLTEADHDLMDEQNWEDFLDWQQRRPLGNGYLGEFNAESTLAWMAWLKKYALKLRATLRGSRNAARLRELERENDRLSVQLARASEMTSVETMTRLRGENAELRRDLATCTREMRKYQMAVPGRNGRG